MMRHSSRPHPAVQPEKRIRVSGESRGRAEAIVRAAHLAASLKRALHVTIHKSTLSTKAIADQAGISYQFLCDAANTSEHDQLPLARLPLVFEACDNLTLLQFFAHLQACEVFRLPRNGASVDDVRRATATMREFAEFMEATADALVDGVLEPAEFDAIEREGLDAVRAILESIAYQRSRVKRPLLEDIR